MNFFKDPMVLAALRRWGRVFVLGGLGNMLAITSAVSDFSAFGDLSAWLISLFAAFIIGGLAAIDKALRWQE